MKTITCRGFSAHYGSPGRRLIIDMPDDGHTLVRSVFGGVVHFAVCPPGISPPAWVPDEFGGLYPAEWRPVDGAATVSAWSGDPVILVPLATGRGCPPAYGDRHIWADAVRVSGRPYGIRWEIDTVTGPLAPLDAAQQNRVAGLLFAAR